MRLFSDRSYCCLEGANVWWHRSTVHRKSVTPAGEGVLGIITESRGTPGFVVRGKGNAESINSASHGAARLMSRGTALKNAVQSP